jgi:hypothetical protein
VITTNDTWVFALHQRLFGQEVINTFALDISAVPAAEISEVQFVSNLFDPVNGYFNLGGNLRLNIASIQSPQVTHEKWTTKRVRGVLTTTFEVPLEQGSVGSRAGDAETANLAMSISRKAVYVGRRWRGRIAVAGVPTTDYAAGKFSAVIVDLASFIVPEMVGSHSSQAGLTFDLGFYTPNHNGFNNLIPFFYPALWVPCVTGAPRETVRVQRSRTVGVGS